MDEVDGGRAATFAPFQATFSILFAPFQGIFMSNFAPFQDNLSQIHNII